MDGRDFRRGNSISKGTEAGECVTLRKQCFGSTADYSPDYNRKAEWESWGLTPRARAFELHPVRSGASAVYSEQYTRPPGFAQLNQIGFESEAEFFPITSKSNCVARERESTSAWSENHGEALEL